MVLNHAGFKEVALFLQVDHFAHPRERVFLVREAGFQADLGGAAALVFDKPDAYAWGGEGILLKGVSVGEISSVGWSPLAGACVALGYVRGDAARQWHVATPTHIDLWGERVAVTLHDRWPIPATPSTAV